MKNKQKKEAKDESKSSEYQNKKNTVTKRRQDVNKVQETRGQRKEDVRKKKRQK